MRRVRFDTRHVPEPHRADQHHRGDLEPTVDDLGLDYIPTRNDKVNAVTLEVINEVATRLLQPENLHFVVVGQPVGLESTQ